MPSVAESTPPICGGLEVYSLPGHFALAMTKGGHEKALARALFASGVPYYLPLCEQQSFSGRQRYIVEKPLFGGYLFVAGDDPVTLALDVGMPRGHLLAVREIPRGSQERLRSDLRNVETALRVCPRLESCGHVVLGGRYRVTAGPLMGVEGKAIQRGKATLFVLEVEIIGQQVPMEIDGSLLEEAA